VPHAVPAEDETVAPATPAEDASPAREQDAQTASSDGQPALRDDPGYDPNDETVLSVRDAIARHDAEVRGDDDGR
jgi:hypothetical protein